MISVAPSILAADLSRVADELRTCKESGADFIHLDVMDGHFVPNITFGPAFCSAIARSTELPVEAHLMITHPACFVSAFAEAGVSWINFHIESQGVEEALFLAESRGLKTGLVLKPKTPIDAIERHLEAVDMVMVMTVEPGFAGQEFIPEMLPKIEALRDLREKEGLDFVIAVDGGINLNTGPLCAAAGAEFLAVGSAFFRAKDKREFVRKLKGGQ
ncbi:MAG: ribulose-phosphate 3-epimerase [candidate division WOR-3 bacterium]